MRAAYLRYTGILSHLFKPHDAYTQWIFSLGKAVENILVEQYKQMGIWVDNNVKFYDPERNISGEVDIFIRDPSSGELIVVEVKSIYGWFATKKVCGAARTKPSPKTSQMMQLLIYLDQLQDEVPYGKLVYYARDSASRNEFDISLVYDAEAQVTRPTINGIIDHRFTMEGIYHRYHLLSDYVERAELPPREYELVFDKEKVEKLWTLKDDRVTKSKYDKWKRDSSKNPIGDWNCSYCGYSNVCYNRLKRARTDKEILDLKE